MSTAAPHIYIADGFAEDCSTLVQRFLLNDSLSYQMFCNVWKEMNFACIFQGRNTIAEIAELSEEVLLVAKKFMFAPNNTFEESVAGLFLLYGLVHLQPYKQFASVRFVPEDVETILKMRAEAQQRQHYDVLYVLGSLVVNGPSEFHIAQRQYGLERQVFKYFEEQISITSYDKWQGVLSQPTAELELLREVWQSGRQYAETKARLVSLRHDLGHVDERMWQDMERSLLAISHNLPANQPPLDDEEAIRSLKQRAMKQTVNQMRHLKSVAERTALSNSPTRVRRIKKREAKGRIKSGSPKKAIPSSNSKTKTPPSATVTSQSELIEDIKTGIIELNTSEGLVEIEIIDNYGEENEDANLATMDNKSNDPSTTNAPKDTNTKCKKTNPAKTVTSRKRRKINSPKTNAQNTKVTTNENEDDKSSLKANTNENKVNKSSLKSKTNLNKGDKCPTKPKSKVKQVMIKSPCNGVRILPKGMGKSKMKLLFDEAEDEVNTPKEIANCSDAELKSLPVLLMDTDEVHKPADFLSGDIVSNAAATHTKHSSRVKNTAKAKKNVL